LAILKWITGQRHIRRIWKYLLSQSRIFNSCPSIQTNRMFVGCKVEHLFVLNTLLQHWGNYKKIKKKYATFSTTDLRLNQHCVENLLRWLGVVSVQNAIESPTVRSGNSQILRSATGAEILTRVLKIEFFVYINLWSSRTSHGTCSGVINKFPMCVERSVKLYKVTFNNKEVIQKDNCHLMKDIVYVRNHLETKT
jgi:hypothetical protein